MSNKDIKLLPKTKLIDIKNTYEAKDQRVIIINGNIYDVTNFMFEHPAGSDIFEPYLYTDATDAFNDVGHSKLALSILARLIIGTIDYDNSTSSNINK